MLLSNRIIQQIAASNNTVNAWQRDKLDAWYWANSSNKNPKVMKLRETVRQKINN